MELLMKTQTGWKNIGKLYATCKSGYHINTKMTMFSKEDVNRVQGQLGVTHHSEYRIGGGAGLLETDQSHQRADQEFLLHKDSWIFAFCPCFFVFFWCSSQHHPGNCMIFGSEIIYIYISPQEMS